MNIREADFVLPGGRSAITLCGDPGDRHLARCDPDAQALRRNAELESARRVDELAADGDLDGAAVWRRIMLAVAELANTTPTSPIN
jgi:hypothetical protein